MNEQQAVTIIMRPSSQSEYLEAMTVLVQSGVIWQMPELYGRIARELIRQRKIYVCRTAEEVD
jgi:hypothetical protein